MRRDCFYLVAIHRWLVSGLLDSAEGAVPHDDATAGMTCRRQAIHDRVHNVMVRCEKLATRCRDLDTDALTGRDQRSPCLGHVGLSGHSHHEPIHHFAHDVRVRLVILIESGLRTVYTTEGVGAGCWSCASPDEMAQSKTRATFRISMTVSMADGFYE